MNWVRSFDDVGIDSISLNPDSVLKTMPAIVEAEKAIATGEVSHLVGANR